MPLTLDPETTTARLRVVDDHIRFECAHELDPLMGTFGSEPEWHNRAAEEVLNGHDSIREFLCQAFSRISGFLARCAATACSPRLGCG